MSLEWFPTANSRTKVAYDSGWLVLDVGSGHKPHPRADALVDRFLSDDAERSGKAASLPLGKDFIIADACRMPFRDKAFDFAVCSHVAEHVEDVDAFSTELNRVAHGGYVETPSKTAEVLRHAPKHRWFVSNRRGTLVFSPTPSGYPLGWFGKLFFSVYFYILTKCRGEMSFSLPTDAARLGTTGCFLPAVDWYGYGACSGESPTHVFCGKALSLGRYSKYERSESRTRITWVRSQDELPMRVPVCTAYE